MHRILDLSRIMHDALYRDASMSLCARAYDMQSVSRFWRGWVMVFGEAHCRKSWIWHCVRNAPAEWHG